MSQHQEVRKFKFGWIPDLPDHRDIVFSAPINVIKNLPGHVDLRANCPDVVDQGTLGSCTANAGASAFQYSQIKQNIKKQFYPSRLFIYYNTRKAMGTISQDSGASLRETIKSLDIYGVCSEDLWQYDIAKFAVEPDKESYKTGIANQIIKYDKINNTNITHLKACLAEGYPFIFGFQVWESFYDIGSNGMMRMPAPYERHFGGHAVMAVGYDDVRQVFIIRNSWNKTWGHEGYCYMPYAFISDKSYANDFWTIRLVEEGSAFYKLRTAGRNFAGLLNAFDSPEFLTKKALLLVAGNTVYDPNQLRDDYKISYFDYNNMQLMDLAERFTSVRRQINPGSDAISIADVKDCDTVGDCIKLVTR